MVLLSWVFFWQLDCCILRDREEDGGKNNCGKAIAEPEELVQNKKCQQCRLS